MCPFRNRPVESVPAEFKKWCRPAEYRIRFEGAPAQPFEREKQHPSTEDSFP